MKQLLFSLLATAFISTAMAGDMPKTANKNQTAKTCSASCAKSKGCAGQQHCAPTCVCK